MVSRTPIARNWTIEIKGKALQKCYSCATKENPELFIGERPHGTGGTYKYNKVTIGDLLTHSITL